MPSTRIKGIAVRCVHESDREDSSCHAICGHYVSLVCRCRRTTHSRTTDESTTRSAFGESAAIRGNSESPRSGYRETAGNRRSARISCHASGRRSKNGCEPGTASRRRKGPIAGTGASTPGYFSIGMGMPAQADIKDMVIAGCAVHLMFHHLTNGRWSIEGTVRCGVDEYAREQSFRTGACDSRECAENEALRTVTGLLGKNVDRNTSRLKNWS